MRTYRAPRNGRRKRLEKIAVLLTALLLGSVFVLSGCAAGGITAENRGAAEMTS